LISSEEPISKRKIEEIKKPEETKAPLRMSKKLSNRKLPKLQYDETGFTEKPFDVSLSSAISKELLLSTTTQ
jgi:hypothetical protein